MPADSVATEYFRSVARETYDKAISAWVEDLKVGKAPPTHHWAPAEYLIRAIAVALAEERERVRAALFAEYQNKMPERVAAVLDQLDTEDGYRAADKTPRNSPSKLSLVPSAGPS